MPDRLKEFLQRWIISTVAALIATYLVHGITYQTWLDLLVATFILGLLNTFVRPILMLFSLPLLIFTLGLFTLIINALLLYFVGFLLAPKFNVTSFGAAFWGALVISTVDNLLRPKLVGGQTKLHELLVFFAVLGGISVFGLLGIVLGPVVLAITLGLLRTFQIQESPPASERV